MAQKQMIVLIGCVSGTVTRGEGVQKCQISADVIYEWLPSKAELAQSLHDPSNHAR